MGEDKKIRVAVLGAGVSGLMSIKSCLEEGLEPICFEQYDDIGGTWYYSKELRPNQGAAAYRHLISNNMSDFMCASDFPFPDDAPDYLTCSNYHKYLCDMAEHFDLNRYIHFNTTVLKVVPAPDFIQSGCWRVDVQKVGSQEITSHIVDGVMVCTGVLKEAKMPDIPGLDSFSGQFLHMKAYREPEIFQGKRVLVIGNQFSAGEVCVEAGFVAKQVYLSYGEGTWMTSRFGPGGVSHELGFTRSWIKNNSQAMRAAMFREGACEAIINHSQYGLGHARDPSAGGSIMIVEHLASLLKMGLVIPKPHAVKVVGSTVYFSDGTDVDVDLILAATGYMPDYSFVECPEIQGDDLKAMELYKMTVPIRNGPATLGVIGLMYVIGAIPTYIDLQCRWIARVLSKKCDLPSMDAMKKHLQKQRHFFDKECSGKMVMFGVPFQDSLAEEIGVRPTFWHLLWKTWNLSLLKAVFHGPVTPIHYRLQGPGSLDWAVEGCLKAARRPYTQRYKGPYTPEDKPSSKKWLKVVLLSTAVLGLAPLIKFYGKSINA